MSETQNRINNIFIILVFIVAIFFLFIGFFGKFSEGRQCVDNGGIYNITEKTCQN